MPLNAIVEKQNFGVKDGGGEGWVMMSCSLEASLGISFGASVVEGFDQNKFATFTDF